jgi:hypothetical protein
MEYHMEFFDMQLMQVVKILWNLRIVTFKLLSALLVLESKLCQFEEGTVKTRSCPEERDQNHALCDNYALKSHLTHLT